MNNDPKPRIAVPVAVLAVEISVRDRHRDHQPPLGQPNDL
jgi:hypothetical protein